MLLDESGSIRYKISKAIKRDCKPNCSHIKKRHIAYSAVGGILSGIGECESRIIRSLYRTVFHLPFSVHQYTSATSHSHNQVYRCRTDNGAYAVCGGKGDIYHICPIFSSFTPLIPRRRKGARCSK